MKARAMVFLISLACLAHAAPVVAGAPARLYELGKDSVYQQGCFAPCLCPVMWTQQMRGSFVLTPLGSDGLFDTYAVKEVRWLALFDGSQRVLNGSGLYRVGGEFAVTHQLTLDLSTDGGPVERFDSGVVPGGGSFPAIDITVSINGMFCFDTALHVRAWPAMRVDVGAQWLSWDPARDATCYDVVMGDIRTLRNGGGDFAAATTRCLADHVAETGIPLDEDPAPGEAFWFLVRGVDGTTGDSYDSGETSQAGPRDAGIGMSQATCP